MLDIKLIRDQPDRVKAELAKVGFPPADVDTLLEADRRRRALIHEVEELRAQRGTASRGIKDIAPGSARDEAIAAMRALGDRITGREADVEAAEAEFRRRLLEVPNIPHPKVPVGPDESANVVVRTEARRPRTTSRRCRTGRSAPASTSSTSTAA